jgi:hypothetical protein
MKNPVSLVFCVNPNRLINKNRQEKIYFLLPVDHPKTGFALSLTSIVLGNHPNGVDNAGNKAQKGENQVNPKISANPNRQKYAQGGKKNGSDYAN